MQAVTGVFTHQSDAERAVRHLRSSGLVADRVTLLTPAKNLPQDMESVPADSAEQPGMGKAVGALIGGAAGLSGGLVAALLPGVGMVSALGLLGAAVLTAGGATVGALAGGSLENLMSQGLPEDEIFVYEDALRHGRSVVVALAQDESEATEFRNSLQAAGAESIDAAREQWWIGLRSAEQEHYARPGVNVHDEEKFFRMGFEAALHARTRCMEFDQVSSEMAQDVEELERKHPGKNVEEPFTRGYQRGRDYYQRLCDESKAA